MSGYEGPPITVRIEPFTLHTPNLADSNADTLAKENIQTPSLHIPSTYEAVQSDHAETKNAFSAASPRICDSPPAFDTKTS